MTDLDSIYREYNDRVLGYLRGKLSDPSAAEDLCSEIFLKITANIASFDAQKACISTWIYTITRNTLYDYFRTRRELCELDEALPSGEDFVEKLCNDETLDTLADALETLPPRERELIIRHYYRGEELKEIAKRFELSYSYIKLLHKSALNKMSNFFEDN